MPDPSKRDDTPAVQPSSALPAPPLGIDSDSGALFVRDRDLHRRINPKLGWERFRAAVRNAENHGFPRVHRVWGGRYWPAVKAWFHKETWADNGVGADAQDGPENFG